MQHTLDSFGLSRQFVFINFFLLRKEILQILLDKICVSSATPYDMKSGIVVQQSVEYRGVVPFPRSMSNWSWILTDSGAH